MQEPAPTRGGQVWRFPYPGWPGPTSLGCMGWFSRDGRWNAGLPTLSSLGLFRIAVKKKRRQGAMRESSGLGKSWDDPRTWLAACSVLEMARKKATTSTGAGRLGNPKGPCFSKETFGDQELISRSAGRGCALQGAAGASLVGAPAGSGADCLFALRGNKMHVPSAAGRSHLRLKTTHHQPYRVQPLPSFVSEFRHPVAGWRQQELGWPCRASQSRCGDMTPRRTGGRQLGSSCVTRPGWDANSKTGRRRGR